MNTQRWCKASILARVAGINQRTMSKWCKEKRGFARKFGWSYYIDIYNLAEYGIDVDLETLLTAIQSDAIEETTDGQYCQTCERVKSPRAFIPHHLVCKRCEASFRADPPTRCSSCDTRQPPILLRVGSTCPNCRMINRHRKKCPGCRYCNRPGN